MSDEYQIEVPPSFYALYTDTRRRLTVPLRELRQRYELCEDTAQGLVEPGRHIHFDLGLSEDEVINQLHAGLSGPDAPVPAAEAVWILKRLAELLDWTLPGDERFSPAPAAGP
jgi:hypothetical protein